MSLPGDLVTADWLERNLDQVVVVDCRWYLDGRSGRSAYETGHIEGAVFANLDTDLSGPPGPEGRHPLPSPAAFAAAMERLGISSDSQVVAYDDLGSMVAGRLWWMLDSLGVSAAVLDGGLASWDGGLATWDSGLKRHEVNRDPGTFTETPWPPDRYATADDVAASDASIVVLDARSQARFAGQPNDIDPRFGHIPGARNAPFANNTGTDDRFVSPAELREQFTRLGVASDTEVIAYCGSGVSACSNLLALRAAGVGVARLYVGSWSEWGADEARSVERSV
jgi:thiosulfate/3-mercaptopyruvate sulfurtransferase